MMSLRKLMFSLLDKEELTIDQLVENISTKNPDIARPTIRGRLSEMVKDGEVKRLATDIRNADSSTKFKAIPLKEQALNVKPLVIDPPVQ